VHQQEPNEDVAMTEVPEEKKENIPATKEKKKKVQWTRRGTEAKQAAATKSTGDSQYRPKQQTTTTNAAPGSKTRRKEREDRATSGPREFCTQQQSPTETAEIAWAKNPEHRSKQEYAIRWTTTPHQTRTHQCERTSEGILANYLQRARSEHREQAKDRL
jgi:hypothetical protein